MKPRCHALILALACTARALSQTSEVERIPSLQALVQLAPEAVAAPKDTPPSAPATSGSTYAESVCPQGFADVDNPQDWRCFFDTDGALHNWATLHSVRVWHDSFWWGSDSKMKERVVSGYASVRSRQIKFNDWAKRIDPTSKIPRIRTNGRLTMDTLLIPYYRSGQVYAHLDAVFRGKCAFEEDESKNRTGRVPCTKPVWTIFKDGGEAFTTAGDYPNDRMAKWGEALEKAADARERLREYVDAYYRDPRTHEVRDRVDCFEAGTDADCSIELDETPASFMNDVGELAKTVADSLLRVQQIQDAYETSPDNPANAAPRPGAPIEWIAIPGGTFSMGGEGDRPGTLRRSQVTVRAFEMSKAPVTVEQYADCVRAGQCTVPDTATDGGKRECNWGRPGRRRHPINCVTWIQAVEFARSQGARLPSESEFEYAARSAGRDQRYPWGNDAPNCDRVIGGSSCDYFEPNTAPVCSQPLGNTSQGLCDMTGNVEQWVEDRLEFDGAPTDGSAYEGASDDKTDDRVTRGANWYADPSDPRVQTSERYFYDAAIDTPAIGFRIARSPR